MSESVHEPQSSEGPYVLREDRDGVSRLSLNRPRQMNLLTSAMLAALQEQLDALAIDESVSVVVLAAAGRGFCAGHDLKEIQGLGEQSRIEALFTACSAMMLSIERLPQPVIARVQGAAAAAGCQLVAQCDLAVASEAAKFTAPGVNWGFFCSTPAVPIGRNLQRKHALELLLTGEVIDAPRALAWGLVNRVVPAERLDEEVAALAAALAAKPRASLAAGKRAFYQQMQSPVDNAYAIAGRTIAEAFAHSEGRAGMDAFINKRPPPGRL